MRSTAKMLKHGRVTIPKAIRELLNWSPGTELMVVRDNETVVCRPTASQGELAQEARRHPREPT
ncbi:MAG: AbrB/MazE/SpoVT family DNA-binding domain-containing protein [Rhizobiales bacterium]|nr:AbrB/MazE/SpoVT family DNA-binding domain-containing protein [Hyphomicrobiales bacterium]